MTAPPSSELDALLRGLAPAIVALWEAAREVTPRDCAESVVVAGTSAGVRRLVPQHEGAAPYAAVLYPRSRARAALHRLDEHEAAGELDLAHDPCRIDVVMVTDRWLAVVEIHPMPAQTAQGGDA